jgi:KUP system potassium uptake protein
VTPLSPSQHPAQPTPRAPAEAAPGTAHRAGVAALAFGALGVVFGDIGTSPLYAMKETFSAAHGLEPDQGAVYGVLSLVFWAITIVVSVKYILVILRADNHGEGGIMALIALVQRAPLRSVHAKVALAGLGVFGAALFYGDGMITPAISVVSAVEGLEVAAPDVDGLVVPISVAILTALFALQRWGTGAVGRLFAPVMLVWFGALALLGLAEVLREPGVLRALSPTYAVEFFADQPSAAFLALGSVVLAVTGAEALYADMGHFGRGAIRRAWFALVLPALLLNYLGQGALLLGDPDAADHPFYRLVPDWAQIPMVVLATLAAIIASQAVITGAFSVTRQAIQLGFLPFLTIRQTSEREIGRIYLPVVNWGLFAAVVALVIGFGSSTALASAYGIAVTGTLAIDTVLAFVVVRALWHRPLWMATAAAVAFLVVDLAFFAANVPKIPSGGWFPLLVGVVLFVVMTTWRRGRDVVTRRRTEAEGSLQEFVCELAESDEPPTRVAGTAVFLHGKEDTVPLALRLNVEHNQVLHEHVVVFTAETVDRPHVADDERIEIDDVVIPDDGICVVHARYGFSDRPDVPAALRLARRQGLDIDVEGATYFLSRITIVPSARPGLPRLLKRLFVTLSRTAASPAEHFRLPEERVVALGGNIEL